MCVVQDAYKCATSEIVVLVETAAESFIFFNSGAAHLRGCGGKKVLFGRH